MFIEECGYTLRRRAQQVAEVPHFGKITTRLAVHGFGVEEWSSEEAAPLGLHWWSHFVCGVQKKSTLLRTVFQSIFHFASTFPFASNYHLFPFLKRPADYQHGCKRPVVNNGCQTMLIVSVGTSYRLKFHDK